MWVASGIAVPSICNRKGFWGYLILLHGLLGHTNIRTTSNKSDLYVRFRGFGFKGVCVNLQLAVISLRNTVVMGLKCLIGFDVGFGASGHQGFIVMKLTFRVQGSGYSAP